MDNIDGDGGAASCKNISWKLTRGEPFGSLADVDVRTVRRLTSETCELLRLRAVFVGDADDTVCARGSLTPFKRSSLRQNQNGTDITRLLCLFQWISNYNYIYLIAFASSVAPIVAMFFRIRSITGVNSFRVLNCLDEVSMPASSHSSRYLCKRHLLVANDEIHFVRKIY